VIEHARRCVAQGKPRDITERRKSLTLQEAFAKYSALCTGEEREAS